jgi:hypothetical protein
MSATNATIKKKNFLIINKSDRSLNVIFSVVIGLAIIAAFLSIDNSNRLIWNKFFTNIKTFELIVLFTGVLFVTNLYRQLGNTADNLLYWTKFLKNGKLSLIATALFLGMMPVKGRTILSAPIIAEIARKNNLNNNSASLVNYLSTHIYYLMFPLSTSLMFVIAVMNFNYFKFVFFLLPGIIFLAGVVWYYASRSNISESFAIQTKSSFKEAARFTFPILVLLIFLGLYGLYKVQYSMLIGVFLFVVLSLVSLRPSKEQIKIAWKSIDKYLIIILALILLLSVLAKNSSFIKDSLSGVMLSSYSIPVLIVAGYLVGFTIGSSSTMVSAVFPLLAPVLIGNPFAYQVAAIVYASEYAGYIASPAHPCCHYAASFFNIPYLKVWWRITVFALVASALNILFALLFLTLNST